MSMISVNFTDNGIPASGLSPTIKIIDTSNDVLIIDSESMSEVGYGFYKYDFTGFLGNRDYAIRCDAGGTLSDNDRYKFPEINVKDDVWSAHISAYSGKNVMAGIGNILYGDFIFVDGDSTWSGTEQFGLGTKARPVNNLADAVTIADNKNIKRIMLLSSITAQAGDNISRKSIETNGVMGTDLTLTAGVSAQGTVFKNLNLSGEFNIQDVALVYDCSIGDLVNFSGIMETVAFAETSEISIGTWATFINAVAGGTPTSEPEITVGTGQINMHGYCGPLKIKGKTGDTNDHINLGSGILTIDSTCVSGNIHVGGYGNLEQDNSGPNCTVDEDDLISNNNVAEFVWSTSVSAYTGKNMTGAMQSLLYGNAVYIDTVNGVADGVLFPTGTLKFPCDNFIDTISIARTKGITNIIINDNLNIPTGTDATDLVFMTPGYMETYVTVDSGASVDRSAFRYLNLQGEVSNGDIILVENCTIYNLANFSGVMNNVAFGEASEISLGTASWAQIIHATAAGDAGNEPEISIGDSTLNISQLTGNLKLKDKTGTDRTTINSTSSFIIIDSTCVSGSIELLGIGGFEDNSGPNCQVDTDAFISLETIADGVWEEQLSLHDATADSMGGLLQRTGGLVHENVYIDNPSYDGLANLTSARIRLYSDAADVGTENNVIATYEITAVPGGAGKFTTWKQTKI